MTFWLSLVSCRKAASPIDLLKSLNLSRNAMAMERGHWAFLLKRALEDCVLRVMLLSRRHKLQTSRSFMELCLLEGDKSEVNMRRCADIWPQVTLGGTPFRKENFDLSAFVYEPIEFASGADDVDVRGLSHRRVLLAASSSSRSQ